MTDRKPTPVDLAEAYLDAQRPVGKRRWLLEAQDTDGQIHPFPGDSDLATVVQCLQRFDDRITYCSLCDNADESQLWCWGEPDRRVIEIFDARARVNGVIARTSDASSSNAQPTMVRARNDVDGEVATAREVRADEVLTLAECIAIFTAFRDHDHRIADGYAVREKSYFFRVARASKETNRR